MYDVVCVWSLGIYINHGFLNPKRSYWAQNWHFGSFWDKYWPFEPRWKYPYMELYLWCCLFLLRLLGHLHNGGGYLPAGHYYCILYSIKTRHNFWGPGRFLSDVKCQSNSTPRVTCRIENLESLRMVKKVFRQSWYFLDGLKVFGLLCAFAHVEMFSIQLEYVV